MWEEKAGVKRQFTPLPRAVPASRTLLPIGRPGVLSWSRPPRRPPTSPIILEAATLDVKPGQAAAFERDFATASALISRTDGYLAHELHRCLEKPGRYLLLARWRTLEAHTVGFRSSPQYLEWKRLLHHYYDPFPTVEHFVMVHSQNA